MIIHTRCARVRPGLTPGLGSLLEALLSTAANPGLQARRQPLLQVRGALGPIVHRAVHELGVEQHHGAAAANEEVAQEEARAARMHGRHDGSHGDGAHDEARILAPDVEHPALEV